MSTDALVRSTASAIQTQPTVSATSQVGDLAVLVVSNQWDNIASRPPAGWEVNVVGNTGSNRSGYIAHRVITDPSQTQNLNWLGTEARGARSNAVLFVLVGNPYPNLTFIPWISAPMPTANPGELLFVASQQHGSSTNTEVLWTSGDQSRVISSGGQSTTASWSSLRAALTEKTPNVPTVPGGEIPQAWVGLRMAKPAPPVNPPEETPVEKPRVILPDGTAPKTYLWNGTALKDATVQAMPKGRGTVDFMLQNHSPFYIAHRGGSDGWPESSLRAYTQAVAYGADALEISCNRTSDGHWVLSHDTTLRRTDPSAPTTPIAQMKLADVLKYKTFGEPLIQPQQLLDLYGDSHIFVVDPKGGNSEWAELLALGFKKNATIIKHAADATWLANAAKAAGWTYTWGYAYEENVTSGDLDTWQSAWTFLGMDYQASQAAWDKVKSYGKTTFGHICPDQAAVNMAATKGGSIVKGFMVSGIKSVLAARAKRNAGPLV